MERNLEENLVYLELVEIFKKLNAAYFDYDGTLALSGIPHATYELNQGETVIIRNESKLDPTQYKPVELDNLQGLVDLALDGIPPSIITARDNSVWNLAQPLREEFEARAEAMGYERAEDGRIMTPDGKPAIFIIANGNGMQFTDILSPDPEMMYIDDAPPYFTKEFKDRLLQNYDILQACTPESRFTGAEEVCPQNVGGPLDFGLISPSGLRVNLGLDWQMISNNKALRNEWKNRTGIKITDRQSLLKAVGVLFEGTDIYYTGSASGIAIDITSAKVNKQTGTERIKKYIIETYGKYGIEVNEEEWEEIYVGDSPDANDGPMVRRRGGVSLVEPEILTEKDWPFFYDADLSGERIEEKWKKIFRTNHLLKTMKSFRSSV